jgi:peptidoglycan/xylan/chitin deacetylase (PgdA/CDA1 family)
MTGGLSLNWKRELLAHGLHWSGASSLISRLPASDSLLVLNYHRIGFHENDLFDPGVFSATADQFNDQISYLKRCDLLVTLDEALSFVAGATKEKTRRCRVLITFDDGYLDNYEIAYPILRSHGAQGVFFLVTSMVGSCHVPWWDHIAHLVRTASRRRFSLSYPVELVVDIDGNGFPESLRAILELYKRPENSDPARFIRELGENSEGKEPPQTLRRFLDWDEAREMNKGGMAIGSHSHSHRVLSQLQPDMQYEELSRSRQILKEQLGTEPDVLAYPVGIRTSFTKQTQILAKDAGFRGAFSFYGGTNVPGKTSRFDLKRVSTRDQSQSRFQVQTAVCRFTGSYWP